MTQASAFRTEVVPSIKLSPSFPTLQIKPGQRITGKNELAAWEETVGLLKSSGYPGFKLDRAVPPKPWVLDREAWAEPSLGQLSHPHLKAETAMEGQQV